jgi:hypothetical protein
VDAYSSAYKSLTERQPGAAGLGGGWTVFASVILALIGAMNAIYGVAAIASSRFYVRHAHYIVGDLTAWGWVLLVVGVIQLCATLAIWRARDWGRLVGMVTAVVNAVLQLVWMPARPLAGLALFAADVVLIYAFFRVDSAEAN